MLYLPGEQLILFLAGISAAIAAIAPQPVYTQFRSQDELGGYHFGYSGGPSSRAEQRDHNGVVRGAYTLVDANGLVQKYEYISDALGYRLLSGTNLPVAPVHIFSPIPTPVVSSFVAPVVAPVVAPLVAPVPVQETPEVKAARANFEALYRKAAAAAAAAPNRP